MSAGGSRGCWRWGLCKLDPGFKAPLVSKFNLMKDQRCFQLEPCFLIEPCAHYGEEEASDLRDKQAVAQRELRVTRNKVKQEVQRVEQHIRLTVFV